MRRLCRVLLAGLLLAPIPSWAVDFGNTNIEATEASLSNAELFCAIGTAPASGDVDSITVRVHENASPQATQFKGVLLSTAAGFAVITNGVTSAAAIGAEPGWFTATFAGTKPTVVSSTTYYICAIGNTDILGMVYNNGAGAGGFYDGENDYTTPNSGASGGTSTSTPSIYASMTGGGGAVTFGPQRRGTQ